jgi:hypothetical protein
MYVYIYVAYNNDVYVKQNKRSQTLLLTHQTALHNKSQRKKSSLPCRYVALPSMRRQFRTEYCADRKSIATSKNCQICFFFTVKGRGHCTSPEISTGYFILLNCLSAGYFVILGCCYVLDSSCEWKIRYTGLYVIGFLALRI